MDITFSLARFKRKKGSHREHREHREHGENRHRGVSAPSFSDGAIPRFSFVPKIKNRVRTENTESTESTERT